MDQLAKDMIQCKADGYGCHYGAWHAAVKEPQMAPPAERYPKKKNDRPKCVVCGAEIPKGSKHQITCGPACADIRRRQQAQERKERRRQEKLQAEISADTQATLTGVIVDNY